MKLYNQFLKWHQNVIKKPWSQRCKSLEQADLKFLRNMRFAKEHNKKGLKMQAKAMSVCAGVVKALVKSKKVKPKIPNGSSPQVQLTHPHCLPQACKMCLCPYCWGSQALLAKGQGQGSNQGPDCDCSSTSSSRSGSSSQRWSGPHKSSRVEVCLLIWGWKYWCEPWASVCYLYK